MAVIHFCIIVLKCFYGSAVEIRLNDTRFNNLDSDIERPQFILQALRKSFDGPLGAIIDRIERKRDPSAHGRDIDDCAVFLF